MRLHFCRVGVRILWVVALVARGNVCTSVRVGGAAFCSLLVFPVLALGASSTGEILARPWVSNPVARHVACPVAANEATVCTLAGYEELERELDFYIRTLPKVGLLYETSSNFRVSGVDPKHAPEPIGPHLLPFFVTDPLHRVVYVPPFNVWPPEGFWASFEYEVRASEAQLPEFDGVPKLLNTSEAGLAVLANPEATIAASSFDLVDSFDGWSISGNVAALSVAAGGLKHQAIAWGGLTHYVYGVDEVMYMDFATGLDQTKWYFEASTSKFAVRELAAAYGGKLRFTIRALYGNFTQLNDPLDWITLECSGCDSGRGMRLVRFVDETFYWTGDEKVVEVDLLPTGKWKKDPLNSVLPFEWATECEIAATLAGVSRLSILGDFARSGEGVALDRVELIAAPPLLQPAHPFRCQQGCVCKHNQALVRPSCC